MDLIGPLEAFTTARCEGGTNPPYEVMVVGLSGHRFTAESGVILCPHTTLASAPKLDTILVPGGEGLRQPEINKTVAKWIGERAPETRRIVSICTGIYALAQTGLLDGQEPPSRRSSAQKPRMSKRNRVPSRCFIFKPTSAAR